MGNKTAQYGTVRGFSRSVSCTNLDGSNLTSLLHIFIWEVVLGNLEKGRHKILDRWLDKPSVNHCPSQANFNTWSCQYFLIGCWLVQTNVVWAQMNKAWQIKFKFKSFICQVHRATQGGFLSGHNVTNPASLAQLALTHFPLFICYIDNKPFALLLPKQSASVFFFCCPPDRGTWLAGGSWKRSAPGTSLWTW